MPRTRADLKVPKGASHRDLSDATLRFDPAPRRSPSACPEKSPKIDLQELVTVTSVELTTAGGSEAYGFRDALFYRSTSGHNQIGPWLYRAITMSLLQVDVGP